MRTYHPLSRRLTLALAAVALSAGVVACGGDDDDDAADTTAAAAPTTAAAAPGTTAASDGTAGGEASVEAFCQAEVEAEMAANLGDPAAAGPAFEALIAAAPEDIRATAEEVVANAEAGPGSPEFDEPYGELIDYVRANCGFSEMEVVAADYSFTGVPTELPAGGVIITMENTGEELHEVFLARINDDTTESAQELLQLGEEELFSKITPAGFAFSFPGATGVGTGMLEPGNYIAVCNIPVGLTPEVAELVPGPDATLPPDVTLGPPHHTQGMVAEFTVA